MVDFQFRVAMDTYERLNGKIKTPPVHGGYVDPRAKPSPVARVWRTVWGVVSRHMMAPRRDHTGASHAPIGEVLP